MRSSSSWSPTTSRAPWTAETEGRFDLHAAQCPGCDTYLEQFRETIRRVGRIEPEAVDPEALDRLLDAFRDWKAT